jgi:hypothetical protein
MWQSSNFWERRRQIKVALKIKFGEYLLPFGSESCVFPFAVE